MEFINFVLNMNVFMFVMDKKGKIIEANVIFLEVFGYLEVELFGNDYWLINFGYYDKVFWKDMWAIIFQGKIWWGFIKNKVKDGLFYWVDFVIMFIKGKDGQIEKYLFIWQDVM